MKLISINQETKTFFLDDPIENTFLSSCFLYFYGKIRIQSSTSPVLLDYSQSFLTTQKYRRILILDYANIIHILFEHFHTWEKVCEHFFLFLLKHLKQREKICIVSKVVELKGNQYDILSVLTLGQKITKKHLPKKYFASEQLCIYNLGFNKKISSSTDDLLQHFLLFSLFCLYLNPKIKFKPNIQLITNDKQKFDKHLFGKTDEERKSHIQYLKDLHVTSVTCQNHRFDYTTNPLEQLLVRHFFHEMMTENIYNVEGLECTLTTLLESLQETSPRGKLLGNPHFLKSQFTRKRVPSFSYRHLLRIQKKQAKTLKKCFPRDKRFSPRDKRFSPRDKRFSPRDKRFSPRDKRFSPRRQPLKKNMYLYTFIKYIQMVQHTITYKGDKYADFYGSFSKDEIVEMFSY
jgi:hypothetical protein